VNGATPIGDSSVLHIEPCAGQQRRPSTRTSPDFPELPACPVRRTEARADASKPREEVPIF
jgi:hypothetical protein